MFNEDNQPSSCDEGTLTKLEIFSLKLFKLSLERAKTSENLVEQSIFFIDLCRLAVTALQVCSGSSRGKIPPLSFEKLLLHFVQLCAARREFGDVLSACRTLRGRLEGEEEGKKKENDERDTLLKHAFDLTWKAALAVEQNAQTKSEGNSDANSQNRDVVEVAELCLELREEAFACLLTVRETNPRFAVERVMRSSQRYQHIAAGNPQNSRYYSERLLTFHTSLLGLRDLPSLLLVSLSPSDIFLGVDYLCHLSRVAHSAGHAHKADDYLTRAMTASTDTNSDRKLKSKAGNKVEKQKGLDAKELNALLLVLVHLTSVHTTLEMMGNSVAKEEGETLCESLQLAARWMKEAVIGSFRDSVHLQRLWESVEQVFNLLRQRRTAMRKRGGEGPGSLLPRGVFPSLTLLVTSQVKAGEGRERRNEDGDRPNRIKEVIFRATRDTLGFFLKKCPLFRGVVY